MGLARNEELLGRGIRDARDQLVIATKFGVVRGPDGDFLGLNGRPDCVRSACEAVCAVSVWRSSISILSAPRRPDDAY
jgi:aryl-alcohol dehydrogenase-like predicted oxidoreductase